MGADSYADQVEGIDCPRTHEATTETAHEDRAAPAMSGGRTVAKRPLDEDERRSDLSETQKNPIFEPPFHALPENDRSDDDKRAPSAATVTVLHLTPRLEHVVRMAEAAGQPELCELRAVGHRGEEFVRPELRISGLQGGELVSSIGLKPDFRDPFLSSMFQGRVQAHARGRTLFVVSGRGKKEAIEVTVNEKLNSAEPGSRVEVQVKANFSGRFDRSNPPMSAKTFQAIPEMANERFKVHDPNGRRRDVEAQATYRPLGWSNVHGGFPWRVEVTTTLGRVLRSEAFYVGTATTLVDPDRPFQKNPPVASGTGAKKRPRQQQPTAAPLPPLLKKKKAAARGRTAQTGAAAQPVPAAEPVTHNASSADTEPTSDVPRAGAMYVSVGGVVTVVEDVD